MLDIMKDKWGKKREFGRVTGQCPRVVGCVAAAFLGAF